MSLVLDLETFALDEAAQFLEEPSAPANYRDPEKIAAFIADAKAKAVSRCALDPDLCRIVAIGLESGLDGPLVVCAENDIGERQLIITAWEAIKDETLIGFNLLAFDLPVLIRRSQYLGLRVPPLNLDRYRTPHIDLMEYLNFNGKIKAHSLSFYCRRFGIDVPDTTSGKDIDAMVKAGDWQGVAAHCLADVKKTRLLAERLGLFGSLHAERLGLFGSLHVAS